MSKETELYLTYIGRRPNGQALAYGYIDGQNQIFYWKKSLKAGAKVGAILKCIESKPGSIWTGGDKAPVIHGYSEDPKRLEWEVADRTAYVSYSKRRREKKLNRDQVTPLEKAVHTIKKEVILMGRAERQAFTAWLLNELI